jgi:mRNA-degrading endonuclease RelE of RelBE toxin-antitoxin system
MSSVSACVRYRIDEEEHRVIVMSVDHRSDAYRT